MWWVLEGWEAKCSTIPRPMPEAPPVMIMDFEGAIVRRVEMVDCVWELRLCLSLGGVGDGDD